MITSHSYLIISEKVNDVRVFVKFFIHSNNTDVLLNNPAIISSLASL